MWPWTDEVFYSLLIEDRFFSLFINLTTVDCRLLEEVSLVFLVSSFNTNSVLLWYSMKRDKRTFHSKLQVLWQIYIAILCSSQVNDFQFSSIHEEEYFVYLSGHWQLLDTLSNPLHHQSLFQSVVSLPCQFVCYNRRSLHCRFSHWFIYLLWSSSYRTEDEPQQTGMNYYCHTRI